MTPGEKNVMKSLVAVAWADGKLEDGETGVIEGLLCGFDATDDEEREILEYARVRRSLEEDIPFAQLSQSDRELLLTNATLLTLADGGQSETEQRLLDRLVELMGLDPGEAARLIESVRVQAKRVSGRPAE